MNEELFEKTGLSILSETTTLRGEKEISIGIPGKLPLFVVICHNDERVGGLGVLLTISQLNN